MRQYFIGVFSSISITLLFVRVFHDIVYVRDKSVTLFAKYIFDISEKTSRYGKDELHNENNEIILRYLVYLIQINFFFFHFVYLINTDKK